MVVQDFQPPKCIITDQEGGFSSDEAGLFLERHSVQKRLKSTDMHASMVERPSANPPPGKNAEPPGKKPIPVHASQHRLVARCLTASQAGSRTVSGAD